MPEGVGTTIRLLMDLCQHDLDAQNAIESVLQRPAGIPRVKNSLTLRDTIYRMLYGGGNVGPKTGGGRSRANRRGANYHSQNQ